MPDEPVIEDDFIYLPADEEMITTTVQVGWLSGLQRVVKFSLDHIDATPLESGLKLKLIDLLGQVDSLLAQYAMV